MTIKFIKDVIFKDQNNDSVKIKDGKILTAKVVTNENGKEVYEIKQKKNVFTIPSAMKDVVFVVLFRFFWRISKYTNNDCEV